MSSSPTAFSTHHIGAGSRYAVIVLLAAAMGVQNAAARKLAVLDLTTTVLLGALIGGALVLKVDNPAPLALATALLATISFVTCRASRSTPAWTHAGRP